MKLLFRPSVAVRTGIPSVTQRAVMPLVSGPHIGAWGAPVEASIGHPPLVLPVVVVWARVALTTHSGRLAAGLCLVASHDVEHV